MEFQELKLIIKRLYKEYVKKHLRKIFFALFLSVIVAGSTAGIAWLLDPAVKKIFEEQNKTYAWLIPLLIIIAFSSKGLSLYFARIILIKVGNEVVKEIQIQLASSVLKSDIHTIESKHSGKYLSHFLYDVNQVNQLVSSGVLNLMKDSLTLSVLIEPATKGFFLGIIKTLFFSFLISAFFFTISFSDFSIGLGNGFKTSISNFFSVSSFV